MKDPKPDTIHETPPARESDLTRRDFLRYASYGATALTLFGALDGAAPAKAQRLSGIGPHLTDMLDNLRYHTPFWGDGLNYNHPEYYATMTAGRRGLPKMNRGADINGDGRDEVLIRNANGVRAVEYHPSTGQWADLPNGPAWDDNDNWNQPYYYGTMQTADVNADGVAELLIRDSLGIQIWQYSAAAQQWNRLADGPGWSDADNWNQAEFYQTMQAANIDGDTSGGFGHLELISRSSGNVSVFKLVSGAWAEQSPGPSLPSDQNWNQPEYFQTLQCADINHDGQDEMLVRSSLAMLIFNYTGGGWGTATFGPAWSDNNGWNNPQYYQTIQCADVDGDGQAELIGRAPDNDPNGSGVQIWKFVNGVWTKLGQGPAWSDGGGWNNPQYYQTIQCADIDGDGVLELLGRGPDGLEVFKYDVATTSWRQLATLGELSDGNGWAQVQYYATIQSARVLKPNDPGYAGDGTHIQAVIIARNAVGVPTWRYDAKNDKWVYCSLDFPAWDSNTKQQEAYNQIAGALNIADTTDIRSTYNVVDPDYAMRLGQLYDSPPPYETPVGQRPPCKLASPAGIPPTDWEVVTWQIYWELLWVHNVQFWFGTQIATLITDTQIGKEVSLDDVLALMPNMDSDTGILFDILAALATAASALLSVPTGGASLAAVAGIMSAVFGAAGALIPSGDGPIQTTANQLKQQLGDAYTQMSSANAAVLLAITGGASMLPQPVPTDYGMLKFIGNNIANETWVWPEGDAHEIAIDRGYATYVWQQFMAAAPWNVNQDTDYGPPAAFPTPYLLPNPNQGSFYDSWLEMTGGLIYPTLTALQSLFDPVQTGQVFPIAASLSDVYTGKNGWPSLQFFCRSDRACIPPSGDGLHAGFARNAELNVRVRLGRDPLTRQVLADIKIFNRGLTAANNVQLTEIKVDSRRIGGGAIPSHHTRVTIPHPQTFSLRLPALAAGTRFTLRISGRYLGGTFGGSFRLKAP